MRTYALYDRSIWVLLFICAAGLAVIVFGCVSTIPGVEKPPLTKSRIVTVVRGRGRTQCSRSSITR